MNISMVAASKMESGLESLRKSGEHERLRLIALLGHTSASVEPEPLPSSFSSRTAYREKLLERRRAQKSGQDVTRELLAELGVEVRGGSTLDYVVLEGSASALVRALELDGVLKARLDEMVRVLGA